MASAVSDLSTLASAGHGNERFNDEAASWDNRPFVHAASLQASKAILACLQSSSSKDIGAIDNLEIGCGTGILSFLMAPHFRQVVAVDAADGMIAVLRNKLKQDGAPRNIVPVARLLEDPEDEALPQGKSGSRMKSDLITSHLVLHHIPDLTSVLKTMLGCLKPGGVAMLTDFEDYGPEARRFHPETKMGGVARHGIKREAMKQHLEEAGFINVDVNVGWTMKKSVAKKDDDQGDEELDFPFLLCYGQRSTLL